MGSVMGSANDVVVVRWCLLSVAEQFPPQSFTVVLRTVVVVQTTGVCTRIEEKSILHSV